MMSVKNSIACLNKEGRREGMRREGEGEGEEIRREGGDEGGNDVGRGRKEMRRNGGGEGRGRRGRGKRAEGRGGGRCERDEWRRVSNETSDTYQHPNRTAAQGTHMYATD